MYTHVGRLRHCKKHIARLKPTFYGQPFLNAVLGVRVCKTLAVLQRPAKKVATFFNAMPAAYTLPLKGRLLYKTIYSQPRPCPYLNFHQLI